VNGLHLDAVVVDCHDDLPVMLMDWHRRLGDSEYFAREAIPLLRDGGVDVQVLPVYLDPELAESGLRRSILLLEWLHEAAARSADDVSICGTGADIDAALAAGKIALVLALEGCPQIGLDVELFRAFFRLGVRMASFTHFGRTMLADGSAEDEAGSRLPKAGIAAVAELERLGILVDATHLGAAGTAHVLELATRPLVASHSCARALHDHHRNLSDEHLRGIAATGGVIGVNVVPAFLGGEPTIDRVVDHVEHLAAVAGIDHIGLGPDFLRAYHDAVYPRIEPPIPGVGGEYVPGLSGPRDLPALTDRLLARGFAEADVRKILGENFLRVFDQGLGVPQSQA